MRWRFVQHQKLWGWKNDPDETVHAGCRMIFNAYPTTKILELFPELPFPASSCLCLPLSRAGIPCAGLRVLHLLFSPEGNQGDAHNCIGVHGQWQGHK